MEDGMLVDCGQAPMGEMRRQLMKWPLAVTAAAFHRLADTWPPTFSIAVAGALAIAACSTDDDGDATVCTEVTLYRFLIIRSISARFKTLSQLT
jgi:hypothetical protein